MLCLEKREIPPSLHFETPNPQIDFESSPFHVATRLTPWEPSAESPRRAAVSAFGIGGTNAHVVLEEAPELPAADARQTAERVGVAAVRYFMVKFSRTKVIAFDIDEALAFEGESGPYLQYAVVRANNIFQKLRDRDGLGDAEIAAALPAHPPTGLSGDDHADRLWSLVLDAARLDDVVDGCIRTLEFAGLAKYAFGLAQGFNAVYHALPVLAEERTDVRLWRAGALGYVRQQLAAALSTMGIDVPTRM